MNGWRHPRALLGLALAVCAVWLTMVTVTEASATPAMRCHRVPMPCCPPTDAGAAHCSAAQCFVQMPQKAETGVRTPMAQASGAALTAPLQFPAPIRALGGGVGWKPAVFRLKVDLRI
jgi:hypothetical protein